jgi:hypothetical protein
VRPNLPYVKGRDRKLKDKPTFLQSNPLKTQHLDLNVKFGLMQSKGITSIAWDTSSMFFDIFIQQSVWRFQPISQEVFQKGYREAITAVSQTRPVQKKDVDSPTLKIFPDPLLQAIPRMGFQNGSRDVAFEE